MISADWKNSTPEQNNLWKKAFSLNAFTTVTPLYYVGVIAGSEFETYNAGKLYVALELISWPVNAIPVSPIGGLQIYDQLNAYMTTLVNCTLIWDATAAAYKGTIQGVEYHNFYFSRVTKNLAENMKFNGYRLTI
jgi:hypothetical protein